MTRVLPRRESLRRRVYIALEGGHGRAGVAVEILLIGLIVANVVGYILQSVPGIERGYWRPLLALEIVSVAVFAVEYALRLWTAPEDPAVGGRGAARGRIHAATRPMMIIDFLAFAPAIVQFFVPFIDLRVLRLVRLLRLLKIARYSPALSTLAQVIVDERRALFGTLLLMVCATILAAAAMHAAEGSAQPAIFGTIPGAMWWAITTLTTVGYGDAVPITPIGRVVAGITMVVGVGLFALPVGIVATGFVNTIHRRDFVVTFGMLARVPLFRDFDAKTVGEIMNLLRAQSVGAGAIVSAQGERAAAMYFIVSGEVEAEIAGRRLRFSTGDFFGELVLLHETMRAASIVAVTHTRLLTLAAEDFEHLLHKHPALERSFRERAADHVQELADAGAISREEVAAARLARERQ
ncbi:MAG TPA: cyclic nucleotide-gated ion channel [Rhizomicrobium sp.]|nr:cyclic nucleotide-gated ion channel [Rhizomicrobium sp.]